MHHCSDCSLIDTTTMAPPVPEQEVKDLIGSLLNTHTDLTFAFVDEQGELIGELRVHKQLLSVRSTYFKQLFEGEVGVINLKPEHRRPMKALIAQIYNSADLPEILDQLDLPDLMALGSFGEEYHLKGVIEVAEDRLASFSLPPMEQAAVAAASEAKKYPLLGEKLLKALHRNCAKTLLFTVRTDKQVKEFLKRHQGTEHELFSLKMKELMDQFAKDSNRDDETLDKKEGVVLITKEYLKKVQREKLEEERREKQKTEKEEKLMSSRRKREKRKEKEVVITSGGVKGDEYNMEEVLAALGEIKKHDRLKGKKQRPGSPAIRNAGDKKLPVPALESTLELTSPSDSLVKQDHRVEEKTVAIKLVNTASEWSVVETSQEIQFEENLFEEPLESPQPVVKEMYEPAALPMEDKQTMSYGLNWDAKEFIPRQSPTPPWGFVPDSTLPRFSRPSSLTPHNTEPELLPSSFGCGALALQHQGSLSGQVHPDEPDHLISKIHAGTKVGSPLHCCSIMSQSLDGLNLPSRPVHPTLDHIQLNGLRATFPGIVPVPPFVTPVQPRHPLKVKIANKTN